MTKEEMFKEMEKMAPVLERNGVDIVLGKRIPGSFTRGYFFNEEAGLWEVYFCETIIILKSRPARSRRRWKSCTAWQSMSTNQPCGIWNESGREKRECRTGRNEPFGAKQKRKAGALSFFGIRGRRWG